MSRHIYARTHACMKLSLPLQQRPAIGAPRDRPAHPQRSPPHAPGPPITTAGRASRGRGDRALPQLLALHHRRLQPGAPRAQNTGGGCLSQRELLAALPRRRADTPRLTLPPPSPPQEDFEEGKEPPGMIGAIHHEAEAAPAVVEAAAG